MTPINAPGAGDPEFPDVPARESRWSRAPLATALPDRFCVVGLAKVNGAWAERFRQWGNAVPDQLAVGPDPRSLAKAEAKGELPVDEGTRWLREPDRAREQGVLIEIDHPSLGEGVERLVVLGVDWTQVPEKAAASLGALLEAQRFSGHLGFVAQGTPTNNTSETRAGFTTAEAAEVVALDPFTTPAPADEWSAGARLAAALGLEDDTFSGLPGADGREHAWASALVDALWRGTAGYYISDILDPLAKGDAQVDADLREFVRRNVFACGPLPTLRVAAQPYGVLPVVSSRLYEPGRGPEELVHRVVTLMRGIVSPAIAGVPHLRRAGEDQDVDTVMLALLQRTPVPWTFRFRPLTGPIERKNMSVRWDIANAWQRTWTSAMWAGLGVYQTTRLGELTHGKDHPLPVPLVAKPGQDNPTAYLGEIADLTSDDQGRAALNLREDSIALLEALAACSAVLELDQLRPQGDPRPPGADGRCARERCRRSPASPSRPPTPCGSRTLPSCRSPRSTSAPGASSPTRWSRTCRRGRSASSSPASSGRGSATWLRCSERRPTPSTGWRTTRSRCGRWRRLRSTSSSGPSAATSTSSRPASTRGSPAWRRRGWPTIAPEPATASTSGAGASSRTCGTTWARVPRASGSCTRRRSPTRQAPLCCETAASPTAATTARSSTSR